MPGEGGGGRLDRRQARNGGSGRLDNMKIQSYAPLVPILISLVQNLGRQIIVWIFVTIALTVIRFMIIWGQIYERLEPQEEFLF